MKPKPTLPDLSEKKSQLTNYAVILASIIIILAGIHFAKGILSPIFMATFLAVLLLPATHWLQSKGWSQVTSLTVVILSVLFVGLLTTTILATQLTSFVQNIPIYKNKFNEELRRFNISLGDLFPSLEDNTESNEENSSSSINNRHRNKSLNSQAASKERASFLPFLSVPITPLSSNSLVESEKNQFCQSLPHHDQNNVRLTDYIQNQTPSQPQNREAPIILAHYSSDLATNNDSPDNSDQPTSQKTTANDSITEQQSSYPRQYGFFDSLSGQNSAGFFNQTSADSFEDSLQSLNFVQGSDDSANEKNNDDASFSENDEMNAQFPLSKETLTSDTAVDASSRELFLFLRNLASELSFLASNAFVIMLLVIFMLLEGSKLPQKITTALGKRNLTNEHIRHVAEDIRRYMIIKTFVSIIVGVSVTILLVVSNVQYPLLWGFIAFFLNFIPNIGSVVAAIPPIILATVDHGFLVGSIDAFFFLLINCFVGYVIEPKMLGDGLDISPLVVLLSLIISGWILGPVGMFLSPPLAVIIKIILQSFPETRWIAVLMANSVPKEKEDEPNVPPGLQKVNQI